MVFQVQADLLAEAGLVSHLRERSVAQDEPEVPVAAKAVRSVVGRGGKLLVGSIAATQVAWLGAIGWLAFRVFF